MTLMDLFGAMKAGRGSTFGGGQVNEMGGGGRDPNGILPREGVHGGGEPMGDDSAWAPFSGMYRDRAPDRMGGDERVDRMGEIEPGGLHGRRRAPMGFPPFVPPGQGSPGAVSGEGGGMEGMDQEQLVKLLMALLSGGGMMKRQ